MNETEKQQLITKSVADKIEANKEEWAAMWVVVESQKTLPEPDANEIAKAELRMKECEERITLLTSLLDKVTGQ